jgi:hypothetical protein
MWRMATDNNKLGVKEVLADLQCAIDTAQEIFAQNEFAYNESNTKLNIQKFKPLT